MDSVNIIIFIFALAVLVEGSVEYFFAKWVKIIWLLPWIALVFSVTLCILYDVDIFRLLLGIRSPVMYVGAVITGIVISRGANYLNDFVSSFGKPRSSVIVNNTAPENVTTNVNPPPTAPPPPLT